jgi:ElaB/YqjD/DUF883 family membrane-anchored ribosome-binding protein
MQNTDRLTAKIEELSTKANNLINEKREDAKDEVDQINKQIDGYVKRLEAAQEKLQDLSDILATS